jgi:hypothetical protein
MGRASIEKSLARTKRQARDDTANVQLYLPEASRSRPWMGAPLVGFGLGVKKSCRSRGEQQLDPFDFPREFEAKLVAFFRREPVGHLRDHDLVIAVGAPIPRRALNRFPTRAKSATCRRAMTYPTRAIGRQATSTVAFEPVQPPAPDDPLLGFAPYLHKRPRRNSITPDLQRRFIATLAATGIVNQAARSIGRSMEALYKLRARPGAEGFAAAWDEAHYWGLQRIEDCALERVLSGQADGWGPGNADGVGGILCMLLQIRQQHRVDIRDLRPGHPVYDAIRAEVLADKERERPPGEAASDTLPAALA